MAGRTTCWWQWCVQAKRLPVNNHVTAVAQHVSYSTTDSKFSAHNITKLFTRISSCYQWPWSLLDVWPESVWKLQPKPSHKTALFKTEHNPAFNTGWWKYSAFDKLLPIVCKIKTCSSMCLVCTPVDASTVHRQISDNTVNQTSYILF